MTQVEAEPFLAGERRFGASAILYVGTKCGLEKVLLFLLALAGTLLLGVSADMPSGLLGVSCESETGCTASDSFDAVTSCFGGWLALLYFPLPLLRCRRIWCRRLTVF
jgi:hypothetical protein